MTKRSRRNQQQRTPPRNLPMFCDYTCTHADFAPKETSGACRREQAVYCSLYKKFNNKHNRCFGRV